VPKKAAKAIPPEKGRKAASVLRNRTALLISTQEVLAVKGQAATIEDIAEQAEVAVSTIYQHFADKDALISATMLFGFSEWFTAVQSAVEQRTDPLEKLVFPMRYFVRAKYTHPHHAQNMVNFLGLISGFLPLLEADLTEHIKELTKAKLLVCADPEVAARNIQSVLTFAATHQVNDPEATIKDADASVRVALSMIGLSDAKARKLTESKLPVLSH
jgi:AcrR family transcriptional regulator